MDNWVKENKVLERESAIVTGEMRMLLNAGWHSRCGGDQNRFRQVQAGQ
jgi:hypothetical protein